MVVVANQTISHHIKPNQTKSNQNESKLIFLTSLSRRSSPSGSCSSSTSSGSPSSASLDLIIYGVNSITNLRCSSSRTRRIKIFFGKRLAIWIIKVTPLWHIKHNFPHILASIWKLWPWVGLFSSLLWLSLSKKDLNEQIS